MKITISHLLLFLLIFSSCKSLWLYFPEKRISATPADAGLPFRDIRYKTPDNILISAWYIPSGLNRGTILFCHGNAGNISNRIASLKIFNRLGFNTLIFDYRGYGGSEGSPSETGTYRDSEGAWNYLVNQIGEKEMRIIVWGRSLGGAVAVRLASVKNPAALVVESSFSSLYNISREKACLLPAMLLAGGAYDSLSHIKKVKAPILIIHSREDRLIPYGHGKMLYENAPGIREMISIIGSHNKGFIDSGERYTAGIEVFLKRHYLH
jgi:uncharacterized protein